MMEISKKFGLMLWKGVYIYKYMDHSQPRKNFTAV